MIINDTIEYRSIEIGAEFWDAESRTFIQMPWMDTSYVEGSLKVDSVLAFRVAGVSFPPEKADSIFANVEKEVASGLTWTELSFNQGCRGLISAINEYPADWGWQSASTLALPVEAAIFGHTNGDIFLVYTDEFGFIIEKIDQRYFNRYSFSLDLN